MAGLVPAIHAGTVRKNGKKNHSVSTLPVAQTLALM